LVQQWLALKAVRTHLAISYHASTLAYLDLVDIPIENGLPLSLLRHLLTSRLWISVNRQCLPDQPTLDRRTASDVLHFASRLQLVQKSAHNAVET
jgi:hypothetical protein